MARRGLEVSGSYLYVMGSSSDRIVVLDISDPENMSIHSWTAADSTKLDGIYDVAISGNYAYVTARNDDMITAVDISDPGALVVGNTVVGPASCGGSVCTDGAEDIEIFGNYAFVAAENADAMAVIDISTPGTPAYSTALYDGTELDGVQGLVLKSDGSRAYVVSRNDESMSIINISTPTAPGLFGPDSK